MSIYVRIPLPSEPSDLIDLMRADMQARVPGWRPITGAPDSALIDVQGFQDAVINGQASGTLDSLYRYAGASLFGVQPLDATYAVADSTWTLTTEATALGGTIPAGSEVRVQVTATDSIGFRVVADVLVAPGAGVTADGEVQLVALVAGAAGSGLSGPVLKTTPLDFVQSITIEGVSQGGQDAEDDDAYLDRLTEELRSYSVAIIQPADVERLARRTPGIARALVINNYVPGVNEMQDITVTGATGGTLPLTYDGQTVTGISATATAAAVELALETLSNIQVGDVECTLGPLGIQPVRVEFKNLLGQQNVPMMTTSSGSLTGGGTAAITTARVGSPADPATANSLTIIPADDAGLTIASGIKAGFIADLESRRLRGFRFAVMDPVYTTVDLTFDFTTYPGKDPAVVKAAAEAAGADALSPANHGLPPFGDVLAWADEPYVYYSKIYTALDLVDGVHTALNVRLNGVLDTDVALAPIGGLPLPGTVVGTAI